MSCVSVFKKDNYLHYKSLNVFRLLVSKKKKKKYHAGSAKKHWEANFEDFLSFYDNIYSKTVFFFFVKSSVENTLELILDGWTKAPARQLYARTQELKEVEARERGGYLCKAGGSIGVAYGAWN